MESVLMREKGKICFYQDEDSYCYNAKDNLKHLEPGDFFIVSDVCTEEGVYYGIFFITKKCIDSINLYAVTETNYSALKEKKLSPQSLVTLFEPTDEQKLLTIPYLN